MITPTPDEWQSWARHPEARAYVEACLASPVPFLLDGDLRQLRELMESS